MKLSKKKKITLLIIFAIVTFSITLIPQVNAFLGGMVWGYVTYDGDGVYYAKVTLYIDGYEEDIGYTSSTGFYKVMTDDLLMSPIGGVIKVEKSGYTTIYRSVILEPNKPTRLDIEYLVDFRCKGYVYDHMGNALSGATVKLIKVSGGTVLNTDTTDGNGYYDFTTEVMENLYCKIQASKSGYETHYITVYAGDGTTTYNFRIASTSALKMATFFYATDAAYYSTLKPFGDQLINEEGFDTVLYRENADDWLDVIQHDIDDLETSSSFVFIYVMAHGGYSSSSDDSYCAMEPGWFPEKMYSSELASALTCLESKNIFVLIESCESGGFVDDVKSSNRFVISTTDHYNSAWAVYDPRFTYYFFEALYSGKSDNEAFSYAKSNAQSEHPTQNPMYNDQMAYTWFKWW